MSSLNRQDAVVLRRLHIGHARLYHSYLLSRDQPNCCSFIPWMSTLHYCKQNTTTTTILQLSGVWTLYRTTQVRWYQKVNFAIFWISCCKMKITQADAPTIKMDCHLIQTNWCPHLCHPHHFYAGCPSWHNSANLSWLGTGTKYAGLHTQNIFLITRNSIYAIARICHGNSVCLSVTWVDQSKAFEVRIMQFSPYSSPIPLVSAG